MPREDYEDRQKSRHKRLLSQAEKAEQEATARFNSHNVKTVIGMAGEPIKVGHHLEGRHRKLLERADNDMRKGCEAVAKSKTLRYKADGVGSGGISQDDPQALDKLRKQLVEATECQSERKAINKVLCGKGDSVVGLVALGLSQAEAEEILVPDCMGAVGFPSYALSNNSANIRRIKQRILNLEFEQARTPEPPIITPWFRVHEDREDNRIWFVFEERPDKETCKKMRSGGWKWSSKRGAWVRLMNSRGWYSAREMLWSLCERIAKQDKDNEE